MYKLSARVLLTLRNPVHS